MTIEEKNELTDYILRLIRDREKKNQEPDVFDLYSVLGHIVALRVEMKSEWSEESYKVGIQRVLDNPESYGLTKNTRKQSEWSEEDEAALNKIIAHFDWTGNNRFTKDDCEWAQSWLKSLRPQNRWKPTKEQIMALRWIMNHLPYCTHKEAISELHEQLVKIYEL